MQEIFCISPTIPRYQPATGFLVLKWDVWTIKPDYCLCVWRYPVHFLILEQKALYYRDILTFDKSLFQIQVVRKHFIRDYGCPWLDVSNYKVTTELQHVFWISLQLFYALKCILWEFHWISEFLFFGLFPLYFWYGAHFFNISPTDQGTWGILFIFWNLSHFLQCLKVYFTLLFLA